MLWELFVAWIFICACSFANGVEPICLTLRSLQFWSILSWLCWVVALALGDRDFVLSSDLVFGFCLDFDYLFELLVRFRQGLRPGQIRKGVTQAVVGWLMGGLGPKSVGGSSWLNSELDEYGKDAGDFRLVQASGE
jgi:hypothetical protein